MATLAGYFSFDSALADKKSMVNKLVRHFESYPSQDVNRFTCNQGVMLQYDFDAYKQPAWLHNDLQVATLIGHPLITSNRSNDLATLACNLDNLDDMLMRSDGVFNYVQYNTEHEQLILATDPLAVRPFYYMHINNGLLFSTQLGLFKELGIHLTQNCAALSELATLGYTLLDHTPYNEVHRASPAELLSFDKSGPIKRNYLDWQALAQQKLDLGDAVTGLDQAFKSTVAKACKTDTTLLSTLSDGLDSRVINTQLSKMGKKVKAVHLNRAPNKIKEQLVEFTQEHDIVLSTLNPEHNHLDSLEAVLCALPKNHPKFLKGISRPSLAWAGHGGNSSLGLTNYTDEVYQAAKSNDLKCLVHKFLEQQQGYLPKSVINHAAELQKELVENLSKAIGQFQSLGLEKAMQLFLLLNEQHHHLDTIFENVDQYKVEYFCPFYSHRVIENALALPVEKVRNHSFYHTWVNYAYPQICKYPWTAYQEHEFDSLATSEKDNAHLPRIKMRGIIERWLLVVKKDKQQLIKKRQLTALCLLHIFKLKDASTHLSAVVQFTRW
ncbi:hypothetical protein CWB96_05350 [Pseudoalteromonas citrea]|uniref:asparagine synthase (glutamine-hydrolyzing) n=1 Tax=Pseudoalteromonas citrea TaxID=43655 RepID=A0A5S3XV24_9GAMM|nr:hypothetical protein [Pseudoalteromonas citrea]TMP42861.1 hypothetical protein CWB97_10605 [Pseudoalteromonas citrea]TMP61051.1 hypothetical protein CWB96_05350 [Pseudoalteromonas citrea]